MSARFYSLSDKGRVRQNNEDACALLENLADGLGTGIILADGLGGHNKGELASSVAVDYVSEQMQTGISDQLSPREIGDFLSKITEKANIQVYLESLLQPQNIGMGTTLTLGFAMDDLLILSHVGDCRVYRSHAGGLDRLTTDHNLGLELLKRGEINETQLNQFEGLNILTRALGVDDYIEPDIMLYKLHPSDRLLFCSDGLHGYVSEADIQAALRGSNSPEQAAKALVQLANEAGGYDNITVLVGFIS